MDTHTHLEHAYDSVLDPDKRDETIVHLIGAALASNDPGVRYYLDAAREQVERGALHPAKHYIMTAGQLLAEKQCPTCGQATLATAVTA